MIDVCEKIGPQHIYKPSEGKVFDKITDQVVGNAMGKSISKFIMSGLTDKDPNLIDKPANDNFMKFFPSGASFQ